MNEEQVSGSDIRGTESTGLNVETAWNIGKALAEWLPTEGAVVVVTKQAASNLAQAVMEGIVLQGRDVVNGGAGDQEAVVSYVASANLAGGVVVGIDGNDAINGIELYQADGKRITSETGLLEVKELVEAGNFVPAAIKGKITSLA